MLPTRAAAQWREFATALPFGSSAAVVVASASCPARTTWMSLTALSSPVAVEFVQQPVAEIQAGAELGREREADDGLVESGRQREGWLGHLHRPVAVGLFRSHVSHLIITDRDVEAVDTGIETNGDADALASF